MLQPPSTTDASTYGRPVDPIAPLRAALRGHYEIEREIGQGAFATVYLARDLKHERKVAIKVLNADPTSETGELRFIREIRLVARLQHPNILPLHDSGHVEALLYYVMPYVEGETVRDRIQRQRQLGVADAACIAQEAADALSYAHSKGIVHRDIKPENILLSGRHAIVADFGIARAIDLAGIRQLTRTGVGSPGTPAYMAPEQLLGERSVDLKADIYSLGCVLYEMLVGKPPFSGKDGFVKRFTEAAPIPSQSRRDVPSWLDSAIETALARNPDERFASASMFASALTEGLARERSAPDAAPAIGSTATQIGNPAQAAVAHTGSPPARTSHNTAPPRLITARLSQMFRRRIGVVAGIGLFAVATSGAVVAFRGGWLHASPAVDPARFVILPFAPGSGISSDLAARSTDQLYSAFRTWNGLNLVSDLQVEDAIGGRGRWPRSLTEARSIARRLGAGKLVWGGVNGTPASLQARAELYDVSTSGGSVLEVVLNNPLAPTDFARAALGLLTAPGVPARALASDVATTSYPAWSAFVSGHLAVARWDLRSAQAHFSEAASADPQFYSAQLWLGQVMEWQQPRAVSAWAPYAERAIAGLPRFSKRDSLLALGLTAMAGGQYPAACIAYRALTRVDSADFAGWYGLGECQSLDRAVVPDVHSPSGWSWRGSYEAALNSYVRALRLEPGTHQLLSFNRLSRLLPTSVSPRLDDPLAPRFAAFPSLTPADTLAFVPYPIAQFRTGLPPTATATLNEALARNTAMLLNLAAEWVGFAPESPDAYESLADVLESRGDIQRGENPLTSAPAAVERATTLSRDPQQRLRLAAQSARFKLKRGEYAGFVQTADSLLAAGEADANDPPALIGLAALTGRVSAVAQQGVKSIMVPQLADLTLTPAIKQLAAALLSQAALGICGDLQTLRNGIEQEIQSSVAAKDQNVVRVALTTRALSLMTPCTHGNSALAIVDARSGLYRAQQAFAKKDFSAVRNELELRSIARRPYRPSDISMDYVYQEAWLRAAIGDTSAAISQLDRGLTGIPMMSAGRLSEPGAAAATVLAMILRADLAAAKGDQTTARRWATVVAILWKNADPALEPTVKRMRTMATASG